MGACLQNGTFAIILQPLKIFFPLSLLLLLTHPISLSDFLNCISSSVCISFLNLGSDSKWKDQNANEAQKSFGQA